MAVASAALLLAGVAAGADVWARKMEIVKTPEGQETVFSDSVSITDNDTRIVAGRARLNDVLGVAVIADSVFISNPDAEVWADSAVYRLEERLTFLYGSVRVRQESLDIEAPFLAYSIPDRNVTADSGVSLRDRDRGFVVYGKRGSYDLANEEGLVDSTPRLVLGEETDSVEVLSERVSWFGQESRAVVAGEVRVGTGKSNLTCDTLEYFTETDSGTCWGSPLLRDSTSRTSGDTVTFKVADGKLDRLRVAGAASGEYTTEDGNRVEVEGSEIHIRFSGGELDEVEVHELERGVLVRTGEEL